DPDSLARNVNFFPDSPSRLKKVLAPKIRRLNKSEVMINAIASFGITCSIDSIIQPLHLMNNRSTCVVRIPATNTMAIRASSTFVDMEILYACAKNSIMMPTTPQPATWHNQYREFALLIAGKL